MTALTKVVNGTDEEEIVENMRNYSGWSRNFEINNILGKLLDTKTGAIYYFIQWEGFSIKESSWVRRETIMDIPTIEKYILEYNIPYKKLIIKLQSSCSIYRRIILQFQFQYSEATKKKKWTQFLRKYCTKLLVPHLLTAIIPTTKINLSSECQVPQSTLTNGTAKPVPPVIQNPACTNPNWIITAYNALSNIGYWQIEPYIYNQKMSLWNKFVAVEGDKPVIELFVSNYFESLNWTKFSYLQYFVESTHPSQYLSVQNMEYFRNFFFTRYTTHNIFIFPIYSLLKTTTSEIVIKDYINKTANH